MPNGPESTTVATLPAEPNAPAPEPATSTPPAGATTDPPAETPPAAPPAPTEDDVYEAATAVLLGKEPAPNGQVAAASPPELSEERQQLLKRAHLTPEMTASWTDEQQAAYFDNAAKRETDTTASYKDVKGKLDDLTAATAAYVKKHPASPAAPRATPTDNAGGEPSATTDGQPPAELATKAREVVEALSDVFGDEMKPLGVVLDAMENQVSALQTQAATVPLMEGMIAEMAVQIGIANLVGDYPSLNTTGAKKQVIDRFSADWEASPHRTNAQLPHLERMHKALADAAQAVFGTVTESAAQVTLANTTKQRLNAQPATRTSGRARSAPQTEDDIYAAAFQEHLASEG